MLRVFINGQDRPTKEMINAVSKRRDNHILNAANHIQFHLIDDLHDTLAQQSPHHKYYILLSTATSTAEAHRLHQLVH